MIASNNILEIVRGDWKKAKLPEIMKNFRAISFRTWEFGLGNEDAMRLKSEVKFAKLHVKNELYPKQGFGKLAMIVAVGLGALFGRCSKSDPVTPPPATPTPIEQKVEAPKPAGSAFINYRVDWREKFAAQKNSTTQIGS